MTFFFPIVEVPENAFTVSRIESLGTKFKFWWEDNSGNKLLYKEGRRDTGEDWSEKIAAELCELLGLPHAEYDFATWKDGANRLRQGVVSYSFLPHKQAVFCPGIHLMNLMKSSEHRLEVVLDLIPELSIPKIQCPPDSNELSALDLFIGYLMLDAWIGNTDRHSENWGIVVSFLGRESSEREEAAIRLAPTFDHASSLGVRLSDSDRRNRVTSNDSRYSVAAYAGRCKTPFSAKIDVEILRKVKTHDVFRFAAHRHQDAARYWLNRLETVQDDSLETIFSCVPPDRITEPAIEFALALLKENRMRLLGTKGELR